jgi:hypothetical protein
MSWFHLILGAVLFYIFTLTGSQMRADFPDKEVISQELRLLMRSRHIYILFSSLLHLLLGAYIRAAPSLRIRIFQFTGSGLLAISGVLFVVAFYFETYTSGHYSDVSRWGLYLSLAGVGIHLIGGIADRYTKI